MKALAHVSDIIIPILIFFIVGYGAVSGVKVYESFLKGAKDGLKIVVDIVPTLIGLLVAVGMLRASGFFDVLDIFKTAGPDSYAGLVTSILMSCTDTMLILRGNEEYLQRQGLEFVLIFSHFAGCSGLAAQ